MAGSEAAGSGAGLSGTGRSAARRSEPGADAAREAWRGMLALFLSGEVHERFHEAAERVGLPHPGALKALLSLDPAAPPSMRAMSELLRCDASYTTGLVDALEAAGYVERRTSPVDRRVKLVHLNQRGRAARTRAIDVLLAPPEQLGELSQAESRTLARLMGKVAAGLPF